MKKILIVIIFGLFTLLCYSQNGWIHQSGAFFSNSFELKFLDENTGFIGSSLGMHRTTDGGESWQLDPTMSFAVYNVHFINNTVGFAADNFRLYKTTDTGNNWNQIYEFDDPVLDIATFDGDTVYVLEVFDVINKSTDGGVTFDTTNSRPLNGFWNSPSHLHAYSGSELVIAGPRFIFKTYNGGNSWSEVFNDGGGWNISLYPQPDGRLFASIETGEVLLSNSRGASWNQIYKVQSDTTLPASLFSVNFINDIGYAIRSTLNSPFTYLAKTYDGGAAWFYSLFPTHKSVNRLFFVDEKTGWAVGRNSTILKTTTGAVASSYIHFEKKNNINKMISDNQNTLDTININTSEKIFLDSPNIIDMKVTIDSISHTKASDLELALIHEGVTDTLAFGLTATGANFIYTIFDDSASTNIGSGTPPYTGAFKPYSPLSQFIGMDLNGDWILTVYDSQTGNTGTLNAWGLQIEFEDNTLDVNTISNEIPESFYLSQNYPNPFNPSTKISWRTPVSSQQTLKIYDVLGNEVVLLVDEYKPAGSYEVSFDASGLSSGIYFYQLIVGSLVETKKMIVLR